MTHNTSSHNKTVQKHLPALSTHLVFFILIWVFFAGYYGDVLYIAQQYSFFTTDLQVMETVWNHSYAILWMIGRALLQLCYYPWLGGGLLALMLTLISWLFGYAFKLQRSKNYISFAPAFIFTFVLIYKGFDIYYQAETGTVFGIPFCMLFILVCQAILVRSFSKKNMPGLFERPHDKKIEYNWHTNITTVICLAIIIGFNEWQRPYVRPTTKMQIALERQDWKHMQLIAEQSDMKYSTIAAYFAIARMEDSNDIPQVPFNALPQPTATIYLHDRNGNIDTGRNYVLTDYCIASGQYEMAFTLAQANLKKDGPSAYLFKKLVQAGIPLGKTTACTEYLRLLGLLPFEGAFVAKYSALLNNR